MSDAYQQEEQVCFFSFSCYYYSLCQPSIQELDFLWLLQLWKMDRYLGMEGYLYPCTFYFSSNLIFIPFASHTSSSFLILLNRRILRWCIKWSGWSSCKRLVSTNDCFTSGVNNTSLTFQIISNHSKYPQKNHFSQSYMTFEKPIC